MTTGRGPCPLREAGRERAPLSNEFIALLRAAAAEARADVVQAAPGIAELLRMIAEQIDRARADLKRSRERRDPRRGARRDSARRGAAGVSARPRRRRGRRRGAAHVLLASAKYAASDVLIPVIAEVPVDKIDVVHFPALARALQPKIGRKFTGVTARVFDSVESLRAKFKAHTGQSVSHLEVIRAATFKLLLQRSHR